MDPRFEQGIEAAERICSEIETAVAAEDWEAAARSNESLNEQLAGINRLIVSSPVQLRGDRLGAAIARLTRLLSHHDKLTATLCRERDRAAAEIAQVRTGLRAASHYLDTAGRSEP